MSDKFFKNKRILVTGDTGFVGSWLTLWLDEAGADVTGLSLNPPSNPYMHKFLDFKHLKDISGDVRDLSLVKKAMHDYKPEIVFHLAAQPILLRSYEDPVLTYTTNLIGTMNVLEACRISGSVKTIINITSDKVYENLHTRVPYKEGSRLGGFDPYSSSKAGAELITNAYRNSFLSGIGLATARAGNIIGGGDWGEHRLVTDLVTSQAKHNKLILRHPRSVRPWTYILDVVNGYVKLAEKLSKNPKAYSEGWNFSTNYTKSVFDLVREFSKYYKISYDVKEEKRHEENMLLLDSSKSRKRLNWKPLMSFSETIEDTAKWYANFYNNKKGISSFTAKQMHDFKTRLHE